LVGASIMRRAWSHSNLPGVRAANHPTSGVRRLEGVTQLSGLDAPGRNAYRTATYGSAVSAWVVAPAYDPWNGADRLDLGGRNPHQYDDLVPSGVGGVHDDAYSSSCRHRHVSAVVVPHQDWFVARDAEIDADKRSHAPPFEFSQPLMRDEEVWEDRHGVDA